MQQVSANLNLIIEQVSRDKGIDRKILVETLEAAILTAAKRSFGMNRDLEVKFNEETGDIDLFQYMTVVEKVENDEREVALEDLPKYGLEAQLGEELGFQIFYRDEDDKKASKQDKEFGDLLRLKTYKNGFGRIAAQTAKQVIIQRVRDAERENIYREYKDRKGEVIAGTVRRYERGNNIIVDLGRTEAVLPSSEQTQRESYRPGDRIMAYVKDIDREARGPQIILSRSDVGLLQKLFEMEVPEIYEGIVRIVNAARDPGVRSKIAVSSRDSDVDPVGACVGMKGSRVQAVVQELRGEKIDIVPWERDPARFVCNAIAPAEVSRVVIDESNGAMELVVPDDKLSLAIGRRGQNVRLASQLTGWRLDIVSETRFKEIEESAIGTLARIDGLDETMAQTMHKLGFRTLEDVLKAEPQELMAIPGIGGAEVVERIQRSAEAAAEVERQKAILERASRDEPLSQRDRLLLVHGVGDRTVEILQKAGYGSVEDILNENDSDQLALKTSLGLKKARDLFEAVKVFVASEARILEEARRRAQEEKERREAEAAALAAAQAEAAALAAAQAAEAPAKEAEPVPAVRPSVPPAGQAKLGPAMDPIDEDW